MDEVTDAIMNILMEGDYSLMVNGESRHLDAGREFNEMNTGFGLMAEKGNKFLTAGGYKNSEGNNSFYAGGGLRKKFGDEYYVAPGVVGGLVTGYEDPVVPMAMPMVTFGRKGFGEINAMYAPEYDGTPAVLMFNMGIPFE